MTDKKPSPPKDNSNPSSYLGVAIVFFVAGVALMASDSTRATGIPFLVLGITFFAISQQNPAKPKK